MTHIIRPSDIEIILMGAKALQDKEAFREEILSNVQEEQEYTIEDLYALAETLNIQPDKVKEYMDIRFPSQEQQMRDSDELKMKLTNSNISTYIADNMTDMLRSASPMEKFKIEGEDSQKTVQIYSHTTGKGTWYSKYKEEFKNIAKIAPWTSASEVSIHIYDAFVTRVCKDFLLEEKARLKKRGISTFSVTQVY